MTDVVQIFRELVGELRFAEFSKDNRIIARVKKSRNFLELGDAIKWADERLKKR